MIKKIVVSGGWSYGNLGDEAIAMSTMGLLDKQFPGVAKVYTSYDIEDFFDKHGVEAVESVHAKFKIDDYVAGRIQECLDTPEKYDLVEYVQLFDADTLFVMSGGGYFDGYWHSQFDARIVEIELAVRAGAKVAIIGQSIGPFVNEEQMEQVAHTFGKCSFINVRDESSRLLLKDLLPDKDISCSCDVALTLSDFVPVDVKRNSDEKICNLVVQIYASYVENGIGKKKNDRLWKRLTLKLYRYNIAWVLLIRKLVKKAGMQCKIVLNVQATSKKKNEYFVNYANQLKKYSGCKDIIIVNETGLKDFCKELASADAIVSCKMHPLIISTAYGVPAYAISQHYKIDSFMEWIGRTKNCQKNSKFLPSKIVTQILNEERSDSSSEVIAIRKKEIYAMIAELSKI